MVRALIVVDVQNDFCEGGSLAVTGGAAAAGAISRHLAEHGDRYQVVVASADWHIDPGEHFSDKPDFRTSWPVHCRADTHGAAPHPDLDTSRIDTWFRKGEYSAAYSAFEGHDETGTSLIDHLRSCGVEEVDVVGIATDHCVRATAADAARLGLRTTVLSELTAGVAPDTTAQALQDLTAQGVTVV